MSVAGEEDAIACGISRLTHQPARKRKIAPQNLQGVFIF
jgi:hypothetical protein